MYLIYNEEFSEKILQPVLSVIGDVSDTSELFLRSLQMYNMFTDEKSHGITALNKTKINKIEKNKINSSMETISYSGLKGIEEMKIGFIVRTILRNLLENGQVKSEEIVLMQTKEYSKEIFDIQYPLLISEEAAGNVSPRRYYTEPINIYSRKYYLCSEWFEVPTNNDRPYLLKWLALHKTS